MPLRSGGNLSLARCPRSWPRPLRPGDPAQARLGHQPAQRCTGPPDGPAGASRHVPPGPVDAVVCTRGSRRSPARLPHRSAIWPTVVGPWRRRRCSGRSAGPCRSARPRTGPCERRCTPRSPLWAVELRRKESRRTVQDRVRPAQLAVLALRLDQTLRVTRRGPRPVTGVDLGLGHPAPQRLWLDPQLLTSPTHRAGPRSQVLPGVQRKPERSLLKLLRSGCFLGAAMTLILSRIESLHQTRGETTQ